MWRCAQLMSRVVTTTVKGSALSNIHTISKYNYIIMHRHAPVREIAFSAVAEVDSGSET
jgi:hypothetical protein